MEFTQNLIIIITELYLEPNHLCDLDDKIWEVWANKI